jgi:hypothetical protein
VCLKAIPIDGAVSRVHIPHIPSDTAQMLVSRFAYPRPIPDAAADCSCIGLDSMACGYVIVRPIHNDGKNRKRPWSLVDIYPLAVSRVW